MTTLLATSARRLGGVVVIGSSAEPVTDPNETRPTADWALWFADGVHPVNALDSDLVVRVDGDIFDGTVYGSLDIIDGALRLIGDEATPAANQVYGTDGAGARGWKTDRADLRMHPTAGSGYLSLPVPRGVLAGTDGQCRFFPVYFPQVQTINSLGVSVTTLAEGSVVRIGLYDDAAGKPANLLLDAGTVDAATTGTKAITGLSQAVGPGTVWVAVATQGGTPALRSYTQLPHFTQYSTTLANALKDTPDLGWYIPGLTGALPSTVDPSSAVTPVWAAAWRVDA